MTAGIQPIEEEEAGQELQVQAVSEEPTESKESAPKETPKQQATVRKEQRQREGEADQEEQRTRQLLGRRRK